MPCVLRLASHITLPFSFLFSLSLDCTTTRYLSPTQLIYTLLSMRNRQSKMAMQHLFTQQETRHYLEVAWRGAIVFDGFGPHFTRTGWRGTSLLTTND